MRSSNRSSQESLALEVPTRSVDIREIRFDEIDDEYIVTGAMPRVAASRRMAGHYRSAHLFCYFLLPIVRYYMIKMVYTCRYKTIKPSIEM